MQLRDLIIGVLFFSIIIIGLSGYVSSVQSKTSAGLETLQNKSGGTVLSDTQAYINQTQENLQNPKILGISVGTDNPLAFLSGAYSIVTGSISFLISLPASIHGTLTSELMIPEPFATILILIVVIFIIYEILSILLGRTM